MEKNNKCRETIIDESSGEIDHIIELLEQASEREIKNKSNLTNDVFGQSYTLPRNEASKTIEYRQSRARERDFNWKLKYRKRTLGWLVFLLFIQTIFMNAVIGIVFASQLCDFNCLLKVDSETLKELTNLAKWYSTAVLLELLSLFCYVIKKVFEKPEL